MIAWVAWAVVVVGLCWLVYRAVRDVGLRFEAEEIVPRPDDWWPGP